MTERRWFRHVADRHWQRVPSCGSRYGEASLCLGLAQMKLLISLKLQLTSLHVSGSESSRRKRSLDLNMSQSHLYFFWLELVLRWSNCANIVLLGMGQDVQARWLPKQTMASVALELHMRLKLEVMMRPISICFCLVLCETCHKLVCKSVVLLLLTY